MNKKPSWLLRSLSAFFSAALLTGNISAGSQIVFAESADVTFDSSVDEEVSSDIEVNEEDIDNTEETVSETDTTETSASSQAVSEDPDDETFSSRTENTFSSGDSSDPGSDGLDYILGRPMTEEERQAQLAPLKNLQSSVAMDEVDSDLSVALYSDLGEHYDARDANLVTPVKYQNPFGICWAFSLLSNVETDLLANNLGTWDLSEEHLAYFLAHRTNDPLGNTPDDKFIHKGADYHDSGNGMIASFFLSTWSGMTTEDKVPLPTDSTHTVDLSSSMVPNDSLAYDTSVYMKDAVFSAYDEKRTKLLISEYNSVSAMIYMDGSGTYYNPETAASNCPAYYCSTYPQKKTVNHAVTLIGWDDNYSKDNFTSQSNVQNDGAWIVKNSYDTDWGKDGYFYVSYEDQSLSNLVCNTATTSPEYPNNYFYDGATTSTVTFPFKTGYSIANIFTANAGNGHYEELGEIVTASKADASSYLIQVYTELSDPADPTSGVPAFDEPFEYTQPLAGIDTVTLPEPVLLTPGSQYSVVITLIGSPVSYYVEKSTSFDWMDVVAGIQPGQSFYSRDSKTWKDVGTFDDPYCFSIKAHTRTRADAPPTPTPVTYQVKYAKNTKLNVGSLPTDKNKYTSGQSTKVQKAPYCTSRFFAGWNTKADGTGTCYMPGQSIKVNKNITLYAQWRLNYTASSLIYRVTGKQTVTCYGTSNSRLTKAVIPLTVKYAGVTYKVTSVWTKAFAGKTKLANVVIGHNVSAIGSQAFYNCKNLKSVTIGTGLTRISSQAFRNVKTKCVITVKSTKLTTVSSQIDQGVKQMTVRVPKAKYSAYNRLLRKKSKTVLVKRF